jgi:hypothetical protein
MNRFRIRYELKAALWFIPLLSLVAFMAEDYKPIARSVTGSATSLQQILSTAAGSLLRSPRWWLELLSAAVKEQYESDVVVRDGISNGLRQTVS